MKSLKRFIYNVISIPVYFLGFIPFSGFIVGPLDKWLDKFGQNLND